VQTFQDFSVHATGFSQWLMTNFSERRIHSAKILDGASLDAPKIFSSAGALPSRKTTRYSPFATRCRFGSAVALPSLQTEVRNMNGSLQRGRVIIFGG
jgi:hypothetical protein